MSFHMGSLGFLTPFQFYSDPASVKCTPGAENGTTNNVVREPMYRSAVDKVLKGKLVSRTSR